jgi:SAM-dependent methyltransferase
VWDAGCGSGQASADLSHYFDLVEATDISASQIANAPRYERVRYSVQPAEATSFGDGTFDAVCVAQALHWFNYERFWPEVKRVLRPAGVFAAWGYNWPHVDQSVDQALNETFLAVLNPYWAQQNKLLWDGYKDISFPFQRLDTPDFELKVHWTVYEYFAYLHTWSATRRCMDKLGDGFFMDSFKEISKLWGSSAIRTVSMDFVVVAGRNAA